MATGILTTPNAEALAQAREILKSISRDLDGFHRRRKECAHDKNIDADRYYRGLIAEWTKRQRAWRLVIGFYVDEPSLPYKPLRHWPAELSNECHHADALLSILPMPLSGEQDAA